MCINFIYFCYLQKLSFMISLVIFILLPVISIRIFTRQLFLMVLQTDINQQIYLFILKHSQSPGINNHSTLLQYIIPTYKCAAVFCNKLNLYFNCIFIIGTLINKEIKCLFKINTFMYFYQQKDIKQLVVKHFSSVFIKYKMLSDSTVGDD